MWKWYEKKILNIKNFFDDIFNILDIVDIRIVF